MLQFCRFESHVYNQDFIQESTADSFDMSTPVMLSYDIETSTLTVQYVLFVCYNIFVTNKGTLHYTESYPRSTSSAPLLSKVHHHW